MKLEKIVPNRRRSVNVSLDTGVVAAAKAAGVNLSRVTEAALRVAVKQAEEARWREENRDAIARFNEWYTQNGDPLAHLQPL
jgi:antitoxin CcdA